MRSEGFVRRGINAGEISGCQERKAWQANNKVLCSLLSAQLQYSRYSSTSHALLVHIHYSRIIFMSLLHTNTNSLHDVLLYL